MSNTYVPYNLVDLIGQTFGRLTVLHQAPSGRHGKAQWHCRCQCGNNTIASGSNLRRGLIQSCGCLRSERTRDMSAIHGHVGTPEYHAWRGIQRRCTVPTAHCYATHGGRGIRCLWTDYEQFVADVGERPSPRHRLFRLDRDGHFEPGNCAWMLPKDYFRDYGCVMPRPPRARQSQRRA